MVLHPFNGVRGRSVDIQHPDKQKIGVDPDLKLKEKNGVRKHIEWLNQGSGLTYGCKRILAWVERIALDLTVVLVPFVRGAVKYARRYRAEVLGRAYVDAIRNDPTKLPPAKNYRVGVANDQQALNHTTYYVLKDDVIWFKPIGDEDAEWVPMPFTANSKPTKLRVDGANLCVEDDQHEVHYRKVLREGNRSAHADGETTYRYREKSERSNFKETWFTLPVVSVVVRKKLLQIDPNTTRDWAISHRGQFNHFIEDSAKQRHRVGTGVTTLYKLEESGQQIALFDPWKPEWVHVPIPTEQTAHSSMEALKISVAASVLLDIGYKTETDGQGRTTKRLAVQSMLADLDGLGWNPGLKFDYKQNPSDADVRVLGAVGWKDHALPNGAEDRLTKQISILQTGEGNDAREIRIQGKHEGRLGYFYKGLANEAWGFQEEPGLVIREEDFLDREPVVVEKPVYSAKTYRDPRGIELLDFMPTTISSTMKIGDLGSVMVYRRVNIIKKAIGFHGEKYDIVLPATASDALRKRVQELFGSEEPRGVHIDLPAMGGIRIRKVDPS